MSIMQLTWWRYELLLDRGTRGDVSGFTIFLRLVWWRTRKILVFPRCSAGEHAEISPTWLDRAIARSVYKPKPLLWISFEDVPFGRQESKSEKQNHFLVPLKVKLGLALVDVQSFILQECTQNVQLSLYAEVLLLGTTEENDRRFFDGQKPSYK